MGTTSQRWTVNRDTVFSSGDTDADVRTWWAYRADEATLALLQLDGARLLGTSITSQMSHSLRFRLQKYQRLCSFTADSQHFPTHPAAFRAAVRQQARNLYGGRPRICTDITRLHGGPQPAETDSADFATHMLQQQQPSALSRPLPAPVSPSKMCTLLSSGSPATAFDELPRPLLVYSPAHGLAALCNLLQQAHNPPSSLLLTSVHLLWHKKEPPRLLRNSHPVRLQPYLLRSLQATAVFRRQQRRLEGHGRALSEMFAYRK